MTAQTVSRVVRQDMARPSTDRLAALTSNRCCETDSEDERDAWWQRFADSGPGWSIEA